MLDLKRLTPEQKIGMVLCLRVRPGTEKQDIKYCLEMIRKRACGCVQVVRNARSAEIIGTLRAAADYPLLIVNDMERGYPPAGLPLMQISTLGAARNLTHIRNFAAALASTARTDGFTGCWGPVIDLCYSDQEAFGNSRRFSDDARKTVDFACEVFSVFESFHFQGTAKHFPCSRSPKDSHFTDRIEMMTEDELIEELEKTFFALWKRGHMPTVMVGHNRFPLIDKYPASLSKKIIDLLRGRGYDGLIYTDNLTMMSIAQHYGEAGAMRLALNAGNDVLLTADPSQRTHDLMMEEYRSGRLDLEQLDNAVRRIIREAEWCNKAPQAPYPLPLDLEVALKEAVQDSITAKCKEGCTPAIDPNEKRLFVVLTKLDYSPKDTLGEVDFGKQHDPNLIIHSIEEHFPNAEICTVPEFPDHIDNHKVMTAAIPHDKVVFVTFSEALPYLGVESLTRRTEALIQALANIGKVEAVVHFGSPFALLHLPTVDRVLLGYRASYAQIAAFDVLAGKAEAKGCFPYPKFDYFTEKGYTYDHKD